MHAPEVRPLAAPSPKPPLKPPPSGRGPTPARPRARVLLYDGSVEGSPVALGEVCAEAWRTFARGVKEAKGQSVVMVPVSVTLPSTDPRSPNPHERPPEDAARSL